jgi:hypothetical protein
MVSPSSCSTRRPFFKEIKKNTIWVEVHFQDSGTRRFRQVHLVSRTLCHSWRPKPYPADKSFTSESQQFYQKISIQANRTAAYHNSAKKHQKEKARLTFFYVCSFTESFSRCVFWPTWAHCPSEWWNPSLRVSYFDTLSLPGLSGDFGCFKIAFLYSRNIIGQMRTTSEE